LCSLKQCQSISVHSTGVTQAGVSAMKRLNPKIQVTR